MVARSWWSVARHASCQPRHRGDLNLQKAIMLSKDTRSLSHSIIVVVYQWGLYEWPLARTHWPNRLKLDATHRPLRWRFVTSFHDIVVVPYEVEFVVGHGVLLKVSGAEESHVMAALRAGVHVAPADRVALLLDLGETPESARRLLGNPPNMDAILDKVFRHWDAPLVEAEKCS